MSKKMFFILVVTLILVFAFAALAMAAPEDPLTKAVEWVFNLLTGPLARSVAVIAVIIVGIMALTGRMSLMHAGMCFLGVFIIFGAPSFVDMIK